MTLANRNVWLAVGAVAVIQAAVLAYMVWDRAQLLANGREIVLDVVPVDPRSLFRGDYVNLSYDISRIIPHEGTALPRRGANIYVTLQRGADGTWQPVDATAQPPARVGPDEVVLKGRVDYLFTPSATSTEAAQVQYGIESYFVPEGTGRELEKLVGQKKIAALIAVDSDGNAGIKGLVVDGKQVYEEPLF